MQILPGGKVPADGIVLSGTSFVDESMLTGEARAISKSPGSSLMGGTVNQSALLYMSVSKTGKDTALAHIIRLVESAQLSKAPIQALADRVAGVFVPAVIALAVTTFFIWFILGQAGVYPQSWVPLGHDVFFFALLFAISVCVVACPCALGLATPTAVMVGTGVAAQHGVLIKGAAALERAYHVAHVVFDKTGTLTRGKPTVAAHRVLQTGFPVQQFLRLLASVENVSEHVLARAIM